MTKEKLLSDAIARQAAGEGFNARELTMGAEMLRHFINRAELAIKGLTDMRAGHDDRSVPHRVGDAAVLIGALECLESAGKG